MVGSACQCRECRPGTGPRPCARRSGDSPWPRRTLASQFFETARVLPTLASSTSQMAMISHSDGEESIGVGGRIPRSRSGRCARRSAGGETCAPAASTEVVVEDWRKARRVVFMAVLSYRAQAAPVVVVCRPRWSFEGAWIGTRAGARVACGDACGNVRVACRGSGGSLLSHAPPSGRRLNLSLMKDRLAVCRLTPARRPRIGW